MNTRRMFFGITLAAAASLGLASCAGTPSGLETAVISADYPAYDSIKSLATSADLIVEVRLGAATDDVLLPQYEGDDPKLNPYAGTTEKPAPGEGAVPITVFDATVEKVYSGDAAPGQSLRVMQPGETMDGVEYVAAGITRLTTDSTVLLFLRTYPDAPSEVLGGDAGAFTASGDGFTSIHDQKLTISAAELGQL